ncbi:serine protease [Orbilia oligospora]|uniref:Serine protease n=2 Tax=Orbilia oligospora TaxID=2813651 RepID=A0A7C8QN96_ORBOL|nr:serine protease [Orbilia oligospora]KAF3219767.1 serine protease [Orbilia oligospora]
MPNRTCKMQELSLLVFITTISVALAAPLVSEKRQQPQAVTIVEQPDAPWGLQRISSPDPIPLDIRPKSREMAFRYQYVQSSGQGVDVYVIDGGVNVTHPEFEGRAKMLYNDFKDDNNDASDHGTMVAGVIGSDPYGVAKNVNIWGLKCEMGNGNRISRCLAQVLLNHQRRRDLPGFAGSVINMSFGSYKMYRSSLEFGNLTALVQAGVHIVASAGNDNKDACDHWPSAANQNPQTQSIISVGASNISDGKAYFSNNGSCVDIYAPGWTLTTTADGGIKQAFGTSLAAPAVAGVLASELVLNPSLKMDPIGLKRHILSKGVPLPGLGILVNTRINEMQ